MGYSPWGNKESDTTEQLTLSLSWEHINTQKQMTWYARKVYITGGLVTKSCPTRVPKDCSPPGSSIYRIFQVRILEWVTISFSRGSSQPRDWTWVSCIAGGFFTSWATREALIAPRNIYWKCCTLVNPYTCLPSSRFAESHLVKVSSEMLHKEFPTR